LPCYFHNTPAELDFLTHDSDTRLTIFIVTTPSPNSIFDTISNSKLWLQFTTGDDKAQGGYTYFGRRQELNETNLKAIPFLV